MTNATGQIEEAAPVSGSGTRERLVNDVLAEAYAAYKRTGKNSASRKALAECMVTIQHLCERVLQAEARADRVEKQLEAL